MISPIALFVYNRPWHTRQTVESLLKNQEAAESNLYIFSDAPKKPGDDEAVQQVRNYIKNIVGFKTVTILERRENWGLSRSIIGGVTDLLKQFDRVIILEDDLLSSPYFLQYMNEALDRYETEPNVISIHGYCYPVSKTLPDTFFIKGADCWGWATWKWSWDLFESDGEKLLRQLNERNLKREFDFDNSYFYSQMLQDQINGSNDSWAVRWYASAFLQNKLTLYPGRSLIHNIGIDKSGTHSGKGKWFDTNLATSPIRIEKIPIQQSLFARKLFTSYFVNLQPSLSRRLWARVKQML